ncbi:tetratricopeptide repeat protein [Pseudomonas fluorescens]|uniref:tetratricopeptide repeat protein n=1 Tax=Pseudomonas fluorescens TaxID=294 RepID=UPI003D1B0662
MNRILKKKSCLGAAILATSLLSMFQSGAYASDLKAEVCPSQDFAQFLPAFSVNAETQQRFTAPTVKSLVLKPAAESPRFEPTTTDVKSATLVFPLIAPIGAEKPESLETEVIDDSHVSVVDKRAGNSKIKILKFTRQSCWVLEGVEDWSISEKDLSASSKPSMSSTENFCFQRAEAYAGLGGLEQYRLTGELFEAALENYVCAAASGDPQASLNAASLSLSGMAPQLETSKVEALFKAAATTLPDGALSLSLFYCQGNNPVAQGPCQHPVEAEKALLRAAAFGGSDEIYGLGHSFETGELVTKDISRALACYQLAADKGNEVAIANLNRLKKQADSYKASYCY